MQNDQSCNSARESRLHLLMDELAECLSSAPDEEVQTASGEIARLSQVIHSRLDFPTPGGEPSQVEIALKASEARFHSLFDGMTEGFAVHQIVCDEHGVPVDYIFLDINPAFERLTGLKRVDVIGRRKTEVLPDDDPLWVKIYGEVALTGRPVHFENYSPALRQHYEVYSYSPEMGQFAVLFMNITGRKLMEEALIKSEAQARVNLAKYSTLFTSFPLAITITDDQGQVIEVNPEAEQLLGLPAKVHLERSIDSQEWRMIRPDGSTMPPEEFASVRAMTENRRIENVEMGLVRENNQVTWINVTATPLPLEGYGVIVTYSDITARRRAEEERAQYMVELERSNRDLEQFAFFASHDLQEPLRKVKMFGDLLKKKLASLEDDGAQVYIDRMTDAARRMGVMIDDLLDYSRIGRRRQPHQVVDLSKVAAEVISDLEIRLYQAQGKVEVQPMPRIEGDPVQIRQLLQNLIGNGLKFHQPDVPPVVRVWAEEGWDHDRARPVVRIFVTDNGIGFEEQDLDRMFQPFTRLRGRSEYEGSGIGLAICRKITDYHHGSVTAQSAPGCGSTFIVTLPKWHPENLGLAPGSQPD